MFNVYTLSGRFLAQFATFTQATEYAANVGHVTIRRVEGEWTPELAEVYAAYVTQPTPCKQYDSRYVDGAMMA